MEKIKTLLVTGKVTKEHNYRKVNAMLVQLLESCGRFEVHVMEEFRGVKEATLQYYDLVLVNYDGKDWPTEKSIYWGDETENALYQFVKNGKGISFYHSSVFTDDNTPEEYKKMLGGYGSLFDGTRRCPKSDFQVDMHEDPYGITKELAAHWLTVEDDLFTPIFWHPMADVTVIASVYDDVNFYKEAKDFPPEHHPVEIPDGKLENMPGVNTDMPVAWINRYGEGRVFTVSIGHGEGTLGRMDFMVMLLRGLEWAATGKVTIDPPDRSGEKRFKTWPYYDEV